MIIRILLLSTVVSLHTTHAALQNSDESYPPAKNIHDAVYLNQLSQVESLLAQGANPNEKDDSDSTPLHSCQTPKMTELLLKHCANVHAADSLGNTPLHLTCDAQQARLLLEHKANPAITNKRGDTPLHGVGGIKNGASIVVPFLSAGAPLNQKNCDGHTPLDCTVIMLLAALLKQSTESADLPTAADIFLTLRTLVLQGAFQNPYDTTHRASALALLNDQAAQLSLNESQKKLVTKTRKLLLASVKIVRTPPETEASVKIVSIPHSKTEKPTITTISAV